MSAQVQKNSSSWGSQKRNHFSGTLSHLISMPHLLFSNTAVIQLKQYPFWDDLRLRALPEDWGICAYLPLLTEKQYAFLMNSLESEWFPWDNWGRWDSDQSTQQRWRTEEVGRRGSGGRTASLSAGSPGSSLPPQGPSSAKPPFHTTHPHLFHFTPNLLITARGPLSSFSTASGMEILLQVT